MSQQIAQSASRLTTPQARNAAVYPQTCANGSSQISSGSDDGAWKL